MMLKPNRTDSGATIVVLVWILASITGTLVNKRLMKTLSLPMTLTILHLLVGCFGDFIAVVRRNSAKDLYRGISYETVKFSAIVGSLSAISKALTFFSYGKISLSLTHTLKSSSPIFAAILSFLLLGVRLSISQSAALCAICFGVTLSSFTEVHFELSGFIAAILACLVGVSQSMISKHIMSNMNCDPFVFHLATTVSAMVIMVPPALVYESSIMHDSLFSPSSLESGSVSSSAQPIILISESFTLICISLFCQYAATIGSLLTLTKISLIGHQVANVAKRLSIIVISMLTFGDPIRFSNVFGMALAMFGFAWFIFARRPKQGSGQDDPRNSTFRKRIARQLNFSSFYLPMTNHTDTKL